MPALARWLLVNGVIAPFRAPRSAAAYGRSGARDGSPLLAHGLALRDALAAQLGPRLRGRARHALRRAIARRRARTRSRRAASRVIVSAALPAVRRVVVRLGASTRVHELAAKRWNVPPLEVLPEFFDEPGFIAALAEVARAAARRLPPRPRAVLYHGLPERHMRASDPTGRHCLASADCCDAIGSANAHCYRAQCFATTPRAGRRAAAWPASCTRSRSSRGSAARRGSSPTPMCVCPSSPRAGVKRLAVLCPSFVADCLETLEEVGIRARRAVARARRRGARARAVRERAPRLRPLPRRARPRRDRMTRQEKAERIGEILDELYPMPPIPLAHEDPFTLLVAVVLSAQCTDARVNQVTPASVRARGTPRAMAKLSVPEIRAIIKPCGLSPAKSKNIHALSQHPRRPARRRRCRTSFEALEALPGVGHKTASVVMVARVRRARVPVDTHIHRLAERWGLSSGRNVVETERDLKALFPENEWIRRHLQIIYFGREYCPARAHDFAACPICSWAPRAARRGGALGPDPPQPHQRPDGVALAAQVDLGPMHQRLSPSRIEQHLRHAPAARRRRARAASSASSRARGVNTISPYSARNGASARSKRAASTDRRDRGAPGAPPPRSRARASARDERVQLGAHARAQRALVGARSKRAARRAAAPRRRVARPGAAGSPTPRPGSSRRARASRAGTRSRRSTASVFAASGTRLHERVVDLAEVAQQQALAALQPVDAHVVVEVRVALDHLARDRLRPHVLAPHPGMRCREEREGLLDELAARLRVAATSSSRPCAPRTSRPRP